ncbi:hypothetical protein C9J85_19095 [Haloferax sp. wsp5]|nr:hypothetical protein C9J85_19095 [Haloferax sp. wsp5]
MVRNKSAILLCLLVVTSIAAVPASAESSVYSPGAMHRHGCSSRSDLLHLHCAVYRWNWLANGEYRWRCSVREPALRGPLVHPPGGGGVPPAQQRSRYACQCPRRVRNSRCHAAAGVLRAGREYFGSQTHAARYRSGVSHATAPGWAAWPSKSNRIERCTLTAGDSRGR